MSEQQGLVQPIGPDFSDEKFAEAACAALRELGEPDLADFVAAGFRCAREMVQRHRKNDKKRATRLALNTLITVMGLQERAIELLTETIGKKGTMEALKAVGYEMDDVPRGPKR